MTADIWIDYDWSQLHFKGMHAEDTMEGEYYTDCLKSEYYNNNSNGTIQQLKKFDGSDYELDDLSEEHRVIFVTAIDTMIKFLNNDPDYMLFCATILGSGGTGKSYIINTLISFARKYTNCDGTIKVVTPSGGAAFNIQDCTLHRLLDLSVGTDILRFPLSNEKQGLLERKLKWLVIGVVDRYERNVRYSIFSRQNIAKSWSGLPVIIMFGNYHQLFPVEKCGSTEGYTMRTMFKILGPTSKTSVVQLLVNKKAKLFIDDMTQHVFRLTKKLQG